MVLAAGQDKPSHDPPQLHKSLGDVEGGVACTSQWIELKMYASVDTEDVGGGG